MSKLSSWYFSCHTVNVSLPCCSIVFCVFVRFDECLYEFNTKNSALPISLSDWELISCGVRWIKKAHFVVGVICAFLCIIKYFTMTLLF